MDIVEIGICKGNTVDFMSLVHPSMKEKCARYVDKSRGPYKVFRNDDNKTPIQFLDESFKGLEKYKSKIGVVIDGSTTRGFTEPSTASLYAQHLNIKNAVCFDVSEACNGWARAVEIAYMLFQTNPNFEDKYILITNNEQPPTTRPILPTDEKDYKAVASYFVGLTFSHVATCTILKKSNNHSWWFHHHTDTIYASHISIPLPYIAEGYKPVTSEYEIDLNDQYGQFCIPRMHQQDKKVQFVLSTVEQNKEFYKESNVICHTWTKYVYEEFFKTADLGQLSLYYDQTGNLGSCSMPYILFDQYGTKIPDNQKLSFVGNAAGGSDVMINFIHNISMENTKKIQKPVNKYYIYFKYGLRYIMGSMGCQKRKNNIRGQDSKQNGHVKSN